MDISDLTSVPFRRAWKGFRGSYFLDPTTGECIAKTCSVCHKILHLSKFKLDNKMKYSASSMCISCNKVRCREYSSKIIDSSGVSAGARRMRNHRGKNSARSDKEIVEDLFRIHPNGVKTCGGCRKILSFENFYTNICNGSGLTYYCISCTSIKNADQISKKFIEYWQKNNIPIECYICGGPYEHNDHVIPRVLHGSDDPTNRLPMCQHHNDSKWKHLLSSWLMDRMPHKHNDVISRVISYGVDPGTILGSTP